MKEYPEKKSITEPVEDRAEAQGVVGSTPTPTRNTTSALKFFESSKYHKKLAEAFTGYFKHFTK